MKKFEFEDLMVKFRIVLVEGENEVLDICVLVLFLIRLLLVSLIEFVVVVVGVLLIRLNVVLFGVVYSV